MPWQESSSDDHFEADAASQRLRGVPGLPRDDDEPREGIAGINMCFTYGIEGLHMLGVHKNIPRTFELHPPEADLLKLRDMTLAELNS